MVDERDEQYDDQEEGEYHFSEDQINYEMETEASKAGGVAATSAATLKESLLAKLTRHRKMIIGSAVFLVLIGFVYKIVMPSSSSPPTDFTENAAPAASSVSATSRGKTLVSASRQPVQAASQQAQAGSQQAAQGAPSAQQQAFQQAQVAAQQTQQVAQQAQQQAFQQAQQRAFQQAQQQAGQPLSPAQLAAAANGMPSAALPAGNGQDGSRPFSNAANRPLTPMQQAQAAALAQEGVASSAPTAQTMPASAVTDAPSKNIADRMASLEQENAAIMNLLQTEYAQKMSDYETQNTAARGKMEELTKRLNRMESTLNQITQLLQSGGRSPNAGMADFSSNNAVIMGPPSSEPTRGAEPKMVYSVQAIIPGRAWLKSESGDTVTVAEGDILRNYGRVTKIDPYDGVVNIDTGNKVITLSYGMSAE